jgi:formylglycine-generating enzyme required for sulfatase activity/serine/threonine protein kinase
MANETSGSASATSTAGFDPEYLRVGQRIAETFTLRSVIPTALGEFPIWLAEDDVMGRQVCLHFVPAEVAGDQDLRGALKEEVKKTRQLIHPNILRVHELLEGPDWAAVVTDAYEGESLARQLQEAPAGFFESNEIQSWVQTVLDTLKDIHSVPVLHRNLSPADLILSADGRLMLANFGTRRAVVDALRRAGVKEGKYLSYTSPQVLNGSEPNVSDDVYALGATMFQLLTGKRIFEGVDVEAQVRSERPPGVIELRHKLNRDGQALFKNWERTVAQSLSKDPAERPVSIADFEQRLGMGGGEEPEKEISPRAAAAAAAAAVASQAAEQQLPVKEELPPEHMGMAEEDLDDLGEPESPNERVSAPGSRPLLTSFPPERSGGAKKTVLVALLVAAGVVGSWFGASFFLEVPTAETDEDEPVASKPMPVQKAEADSDLKFVAPPAPGAPELTALRPGSPSKSKVAPADALDAELLNAPSPLAVEPAAKPAPQTPEVAAAPAPAPPAVSQTPPAPSKPAPPVEDPDFAGKQALEAARKKAESIKQQEELAKKELEEIERIKAEKAAALAAAPPHAPAPEPPAAPTPTPSPAAPPAAPVAPPPPAAPAKPAPVAAAKPEPPVKPTAPVAEAPKPAKTAGFENSLGMKFVSVGDVQFSTTVTRVKDYAQFIKETGYPKTSWSDPGYEQGPDHPVVKVSWTDALSFCKWLTDKEQAAGILGPNEYYRLPTDVEWSKAAGLPTERGQTPEMRDMSVQDQYPWGKQWPPPKGAGNYTGRESGAEVSIPGYEDGFAHTSPVGSFQPNSEGLFDMGGNVWQWCMDTWNTKARSRVLRGASFSQGALQMSLLSSCRIHSMPDRESDNYGFRVIKVEGSKKGR